MTKADMVVQNVPTVTVSVKLKKELKGNNGLYAAVFGGNMMFSEHQKVKFCLHREDWLNQLKDYFNVDQAESIKITSDQHINPEY